MNYIIHFQFKGLDWELARGIIRLFLLQMLLKNNFLLLLMDIINRSVLINLTEK